MQHELPLIDANYTTRRELLALAQQGPGESFRLFVPTAGRVARGQSLRLKVTFGDCSRNFYITGRVLEPSQTPAGELGFRMAIVSREERRAFSHLHEFCARNKAAAKRSPTWIECTIRTGSERLTGAIRDLSISGGFIASKTVRALSPGTHVDLELRTGLLGLSKTLLKAGVVWRGDKDGVPGFGAEFISSPSQIVELMRKHRLRSG